MFEKISLYFSVTFLVAFLGVESNNDMPLFENNVFILNSNNFDQFVDNNEITLVMFYAPWCGHCKEMMPYFHEGAKLLRENESFKTDKTVVFAKVDATIEKQLTARFDIKAFPTLKVIRKGVVYEYDGPKSESKEIAKFMKKEARSDWNPDALEIEDSVYVIKSEKMFDNFLKEHELSCVFFYAPWCSHCNNMKPFFHEAAKLLETDAKFKPETPITLAKVDATSVKSLGQRFNITGFPTLKIFRSAVEHSYDGPRSEGEEIATYLKREARKGWTKDGLEEEDNVFVIKTEAVYEEFITKHDLFVLFIYAPWCGHCTNMKPHYHEAAKLLKEDPTFKTDTPVVLAKVDATAQASSGWTSRFNVKGFPTLKIIRKGEITFYEGPRSPATEIAKYLQEQASKDWKPEVLAEEDNVFVLKTESMYDEFVSKNNLAILFFYAPWCGHCTSMKPFYHEAARLLKEDPEFKPDKPVVLAKIDATSAVSLAARFNLEGYPTLKIARNAEISEYEGPRKEGKDIAKYIQGEASNDWKPPVSVVVSLEKSTFDDFVNNNDISLVEFYSPHCGHCIKLKPIYEKAAKILAAYASPIPLAKVDVSTEKDLSEKYKITGYPSLRIFRRGRDYETKGGSDLTAEEIVDTMIKARSAGLPKKVENMKQFASQIRKPFEIYTLGVFENENDELYKVYLNFTIKFSQELKAFYSFGQSDFKFKKPSIIVYYHDMMVPKNQPKFKEFDGNTAIQLEEFVLEKSLPLVSFATSQNKILAFDKIKPICYLMFDIDIELKSHIISHRDKIFPIAQKFKEITFVMANQTENSDLEKRLYLDKSNNEVNFACINIKNKLFIFNEDSDELDTDELMSFVQKMANGKLKPYWRSEKAPKENKGLVKKVVGSTIDSFIKTPNKEIFIVFYKESDVPKFEKMLNKFAKKYAAKNFLVGTMDVEKNDYPDMFNVNPEKKQIFLVSSNKKSEAQILFGDMEMLLDENFPMSLDLIAQKTLENIIEKDKKEEL